MTRLLNQTAKVKDDYDHCRKGGYDHRIKCFHLLRETDDAIVGFAGLTRYTEDQSLIVNAYVRVDRMFLLEDLRRSGLGHLMVDNLFSRIVEWLDACGAAAKLNGQAFRVMSASEIASEAGGAVMRHLDRRLQAHCREMGWQFEPSTLGVKAIRHDADTTR